MVYDMILYYNRSCMSTKIMDVHAEAYQYDKRRNR